MELLQDAEVETHVQIYLGLKNRTRSITIHIYFLFFLFLANNKNKFKITSDVYNINTRPKLNFHQPLRNLSLYIPKMKH